MSETDFRERALKKALGHHGPQYADVQTGEFEFLKGQQGASRVLLWSKDGAPLFTTEEPGQVEVKASALPTGAATGAKQDTGNTALADIKTAVEGTIDTRVTGGNVEEVVDYFDLVGSTYTFKNDICGIVGVNSCEDKNIIFIADDKEFKLRPGDSIQAKFDTILSTIEVWEEVAYYPIIEKETNLIDYSGNGYNATAHGGITTAKGIIPNSFSAVESDGESGSYIATPVDVKNKDSLFIEYHFKFPSLQTSSNWLMHANQYRTAGGVSKGWFIGTNTVLGVTRIVVLPHVAHEELSANLEALVAHVSADATFKFRAKYTNKKVSLKVEQLSDGEYSLIGENSMTTTHTLATNPDSDANLMTLLAENENFGENVTGVLDGFKLYQKPAPGSFRLIGVN